MTTKARLSEFFASRWYGKPGLLLLLMPFAWLFALLATLRRLAYQRGLWSRPQLPVPVIVVGNVTVGGTGKTPVVVWLARQLRAAGYRPGIVSRGYGATAGSQSPVMVSGQDSSRYGDEPVLLAAQTGCPVCIGKNRVAAVQRVAQEDVNVVLADDGLQHYRMRRTAEIVVVDGARGFGNGHLLPVGPLREPVSRLQGADAVLLNGASAAVAGLVFHLEHADMRSLADDTSRPLTDLAGKRVWAVAGIGNPERFTLTLENAGLAVDSVSVPDHGTIDLQALRAQRAQPILMTEKDAVKYRGAGANDAWYLPVEACFAPEDKEKLLGLLQKCLQSAGQPV
jgi:tetraacyldisaccharide 4'-kinase